MTPAPASMASGLISAKCPSSACKTTAIHDLCDCCYGWLRTGAKPASARLRRGSLVHLQGLQQGVHGGGCRCLQRSRGWPVQVAGNGRSGLRRHRHVTPCASPACRCPYRKKMGGARAAHARPVGSRWAACGGEARGPVRPWALGECSREKNAWLPGYGWLAKKDPSRPRSRESPHDETYFVRISFPSLVVLSW